MTTAWIVSTAALVAGLLITEIRLLLADWKRARLRARLYRQQPYWAALAIVARVEHQRADEKAEPPVKGSDFDDERTEVLVLPPQPRPYLEPLLPAPRMSERTTPYGSEIDRRYHLR